MNNDLIRRSYLKNLPFERLIHTDFGETAIPIEEIDNAPTVPNEYMRGYEAAEREYKRPQGEWLFDKENSFTIDMYRCSICGYFGDTHFKFCPNCGAEMRGAE